MFEVSRDSFPLFTPPRETNWPQWICVHRQIDGDETQWWKLPTLIFLYYKPNFFRHLTLTSNKPLMFLSLAYIELLLYFSAQMIRIEYIYMCVYIGEKWFMIDKDKHVYDNKNSLLNELNSLLTYLLLFFDGWSVI
mgnify:CR=1 FL=1